MGPLFVDWNAYRTTFETYAERALGHRVTVLGKADARLLPTPTLVFTDVRVGEAEDPLMVVSRFSANIELTPLLNGEIRVVEMRLDEPSLRLALDESGRIDWLTAATRHDRSQIDPAAVELNSVDVQSGRVEVIDARTGKTYLADDVNLNISARSLEGPYKIEGAAVLDGARHSLRIATGRQDAEGKLRVKAELVPTDLPATLQLDGLLGEEDGSPRYAGDFVLASVALVEPSADGKDTANAEPVAGSLGRQAARLWQGEGKFELNPSRLDIPQFTFRYGREDRPFRVEGSGTSGLGETPRFEARLVAKQVDLDRIFGAGPSDPVDLDQAASVVLSTLKELPLPPIPGTLTVDMPGLVVGGSIIQDIGFDAQTLPRGWKITALEAHLPGRARFVSNGELLLGETPSFQGRAHLESRQPSAFAAWWRRGVPARPLTLDPFAVDARVEISPGALVLSGIDGSVGDSGMTGSLAWRSAAGGERSVVTADMDADRLDLDQVQAVIDFASARKGARGEGVEAATIADSLANTDVSLRLAVAELLLGETKADDVELTASYTQGSLNVERLFAADFAGARIEAAGQVNALTSTPDGRFEAKLEAAELAGLRDVLLRLFPDSAVVAHFAEASDALAPARLDAVFTARADAASGSTATLALNGELAGSAVETRIGFTGRVDAWRDADLDAEAHVRAGDAVTLLRQAGFDVVPLRDTGPASLDVTATGVIKSGLALQVFAGGIGSELEAQGRIGFPPFKAPDYMIDAALRSDDLTPFGLMSGRVLPVLAGEVPLEATAKIEGEGLAATMSAIEARIGTATIAGSMSGDFGAPRPLLDGDIRTSHASAQLFTELVLGADIWSSVDGAQASASVTDGAENRWPSGAFGTPFLRGSALRLTVKADAADIGLERPAENARFSLQASSGELAVDDFEADFEGGRLSGSLLIKRSGGEAAVSGNLKAVGADLQGLVWRRGGRPVARGELDLSVDFEGAGRSVSGIVAGLAGGGTFQVRDGELRGINPAAFASVIRAADAGLALEDMAIRKAFLSHLDAGSMPFRSIDGSLTLAAGTARARNVVIDTDSATAFGTAQIDLERWQVDSDWSLKVDPGENAVTGAEPQVGLVFRGSLDAPQRSVDIAPLTAFLTLRAFEQEVRRVEKLQADILERDRFLRELRKLRQEKQRRAREAAEAAEENTRNADEAQARSDAEEEARRKAEAEAAAQRKAAEEEKAREKAKEKASEKTENTPAAGGADAGAAAPVSFADRIRSAIEDGIDTGAGDTLPRLSTTESIGNHDGAGSGGGELPAADGPVTLEGLLAPLEAPQDAEIVESPPAAPSSPVSRTAGQSRSEPDSRVPRYIQGPRNMVIPNPAYPGN